MPDIRLPLPGLHPPKSLPRAPLSHQSPISLSFIIESPPLMFFGNVRSSTGALLSGRLHLVVNADSAVVHDFKMRLAKELTRKTPYHANCPDCALQTSDLTTWSLHREPASLRQGIFPFGGQPL